MLRSSKATPTVLSDKEINGYATTSAYDGSEFQYAPDAGGKTATETNVAKYTPSDDGESVAIETAAKYAYDRRNGHKQLYYSQYTDTGALKTGAGRTAEKVTLAEYVRRYNLANSTSYTVSGVTALPWANRLPVYEVNYVKLDTSKDISSNTVRHDIDAVDASFNEYGMLSSADKYAGNYVNTTHDTEFYLVSRDSDDATDSKITGITYIKGYENLPKIAADDIRAMYAVATNTTAAKDEADYWVADVVVIEAAGTVSAWNSVSLTYFNRQKDTGDTKHLDALDSMTENPEVDLVPKKLGWPDQWKDYGFYALYDTTVAEPEVAASCIVAIDKNFNSYGIHAATVWRSVSVYDKAGNTLKHIVLANFNGSKTHDPLYSNNNWTNGGAGGNLWLDIINDQNEKDGIQIQATLGNGETLTLSYAGDVADTFTAAAPNLTKVLNVDVPAGLKMVTIQAELSTGVLTNVVTPAASDWEVLSIKSAGTQKWDIVLKLKSASQAKSLGYNMTGCDAGLYTAQGIIEAIVADLGKEVVANVTDPTTQISQADHDAAQALLDEVLDKPTDEYTGSAAETAVETAIGNAAKTELDRVYAAYQAETATKADLYTAAKSYKDAVGTGVADAEADGSYKAAKDLATAEVMTEFVSAAAPTTLAGLPTLLTKVPSTEAVALLDKAAEVAEATATANNYKAIYDAAKALVEAASATPIVKATYNAAYEAYIALVDDNAAAGSTPKLNYTLVNALTDKSTDNVFGTGTVDLTDALSKNSEVNPAAAKVTNVTVAANIGVITKTGDNEWTLALVAGKAMTDAFPASEDGSTDKEYGKALVALLTVTKTDAATDPTYPTTAPTGTATEKSIQITYPASATGGAPAVITIIVKVTTDADLLDKDAPAVEAALAAGKISTTSANGLDETVMSAVKAAIVAKVNAVDGKSFTDVAAADVTVTLPEDTDTTGTGVHNVEGCTVVVTLKKSAATKAVTVENIALQILVSGTGE